MQDQSQNGEATVVKNYFGNYIGKLLDCGANDGITFSNSFNLIEAGWQAILLEPGICAYERLSAHYINHTNVECQNLGLSSESASTLFYESGPHLPNGTDVGLLSSQAIQPQWKHLTYKEVEAKFYSWNDSGLNSHVFDFITIDCEGQDWEILQQIDLAKVNCKCVCIEWNSNLELCERYTRHCGSFHLNEIHRNSENIIFAI